MAVPQLRSEVLVKANLLQVLVALSFQLDRKQKGILERIRLEAGAAPARELRRLRDLLDTNISRIGKSLGCRYKPEKFYRHFVEHEFNAGFSYAYVPKYFLEQMFSDYDKIISGWSLFPAQTLIGFDFGGVYEQTRSLEFFLPEAALYEDMCFAYNQAVLSRYEPKPGTIDKIRSKTHKFYARTAVLSAFYFVEAYLNGIAFDFLFRTGRDRELSIDDTDKLHEWDSKREREKWVSFRDKMLQYPKIVLGAKDPPFTESSCQEMRTLTSEAKALRDSLVHSSPRIEAEIVGGKRQLIGRKVRSILQVGMDDTTKIVDAAVSFAVKVNALLLEHGHGQALDWLYPRDNAGLFPGKVFE